MPLATGQVLQNRYRVVALLGQGGMGAVYRASDLRLKSDVALKEMSPDPGLDASTLDELRQQFEQEAVVLAKLDHPNLVRVIDFFEEGDNAYLVMDLVEGESLDDRIAREGALPEKTVLAWAAQLLDALHYCHGQGIVHRDVKPQNVILRPDGRAVLVDFGLIKLWKHNPHTQAVLRGMGSPEYAPPEQYGTRGQHTDPRSDLYSLGSTLYHALTGEAPPTSHDRMADPALFIPVWQANPHVSVQTATAVQKAMELPRDQRFTDAQQMAAALTAASATTREITARKLPAVTRKTKTAALPAVVIPDSKRKPGFIAAIPVWGWGLLFIALLSGSWGVWSVLRSEAATTTRVAQTLAPVSAFTPTATLQPTMTPTATLQPTMTSTVTPQPTATSTVTPQPTMTSAATPQPTATLAATPTYAPGDTWTRPADGMTMVYVPAGEFRMGSTDAEVNAAIEHCKQILGDCPPEKTEDEQPMHTVVLDSFWLDRTEITNEQYAMCVASGVCEAPIYDYEADGFIGEQQPAVSIDWHNAAAYCTWVGARLPTEAEWEYAARGPEGHLYPWGNNFDGTKLNYCDENCYSAWADENYYIEWADKNINDGYAFAAPVGSFPEGRSWVGALDMAGNVWEWVADWYAPYASESQTNPEGPTQGQYRVIRGAGWGGIQSGVLSSNRQYMSPTETRADLGFRCVATRDQNPLLSSDR
ncbi:MAG: SUMF1/EgtB/PvdO family nonheme iron enzyme [Anaerolineae bacterium]|nr:SUMF1/EgtB/PvdO family nonheme iron enzyme [Anaerolineae bacterium]